MNPAIYFEPDGYLISGPKLMGRHSAGWGFLRAHVKGRAEGVLAAYTPRKTSAAAFREAVHSLDPQAKAAWIPHGGITEISRFGVLYWPDLNMQIPATARLRAGADRYAICGVTHTLSTSGSMGLAAGLLTAPLFPWDALVCTSSVAETLIEDAMAAQADYLAWRFGRAVDAPRIRLQRIPLGVHCEDFDFGPEDRAAARAAFGIADDEVVSLFAGRLAFHAKANPFQMYKALQAVAETTGRKQVLIHAGQFPADEIEAAYRAAVAAFCPSVRCLFVDGKDAAHFQRTWAAADIFISLSDSIQETFGITPVEAMASGLPVLVTDWDGYKDTVRDGTDGFRIPTWQPAAGFGAKLARDYELEANDYDQYLARTGLTVSAELKPLVEKLTALVTDPDLRARMGAAGRARAREVFDWAVVYRQYQALWDDQRRMLQTAKAPPAAPAAGLQWRDPFSVFGHFPTHAIGPQTVVALAPGAGPEALGALSTHVFMFYERVSAKAAELLFGALAQGPLSVADLAEAAKLPVPDTAQSVARLAKMCLVELSQPTSR